MTIDSTTTPNPFPPEAASPQTGRRYRIAHLSLGLQVGGLERLLIEFARHFDREQFELEFVAFDEVGPPATEIRKLGLEVHRLHCTQESKWQQLKLTRSLLVDRGIDLVHTHNSYPHLYGTFAARLAGLPVIHTRHGRRFSLNRSERWQFLLASRFADQVVGVSDDATQLCRQIGHLSDKQAMRIWNGIDTTRFPFHGGVDQPHAITVGRLAPEKGLGDLVAAADIVRQTIPEFRLTIVGEGIERLRLEDDIQRLQLHKTVRLLGQRSDIQSELAQAGCYVCSSYTEGLSLTLLEAMSAGLPVIATDVGGNPEVVVPEETGVLVPAHDPQALAAAMIRVCTDMALRQELGFLARHRVEQHFDVRHMVRTYERLYVRSLIAQEAD